MNKFDVALNNIKQSNRKKGLDYFKSGHVLSINDKAGVISAQIKGSYDNKYRAIIKYDKDKITSYSCNCPVQGECKHIAALLYYLSDKVEKESVLMISKGQTFTFVMSKLNNIDNPKNNMPTIINAEKLFLSLQFKMPQEEKEIIFRKLLSFDIGTYQTFYNSISYSVEEIIKRCDLSDDKKIEIIIDLIKNGHIKDSFLDIVNYSINSNKKLKEALFELINEKDSIYYKYLDFSFDSHSMLYIEKILSNLQFDILKKVAIATNYNHSYYDYEKALEEGYSSLVSVFLLSKSSAYFAYHVDFNKTVDILKRRFSQEEIDYILKRFVVTNGLEMRIYLQAKPFISTNFSDEDIKVIENKANNSFEVKFVKLLERGEDFPIDQKSLAFVPNSLLKTIHQKTNLNKEMCEKTMYQDAVKYIKSAYDYRQGIELLDYLIFVKSKYVKNIAENKTILDKAKEVPSLRGLLMKTHAYLQFEIYPINMEAK